ncbi:MAG: mechanosensitive ion channel family protein [Flavobacteriaceae bacterium]
MDLNRYLFIEFLNRKNIDIGVAWWIDFLITSCLLILTSFLLAAVSRMISRNILIKLSRQTKTHLDDYLLSSNFPKYISRIIPYIFLISVIPFWIVDSPTTTSNLTLLLNVYGVIVSIWIFRSILQTLHAYLITLESFKDKPIDSYVQVFMLLIWIIGIIVIFSIISGKEIGYFLTAMGAFSAVLLLIFKDTILGFVASIQIAANDLVRIGDWVTMEKYGADGDVIEINLSTIKIQNFDKTITTIPSYNLISDSFKNWRGMAESAGRRIKRSILISTPSIRFLESDELEKLRQIERISTYLSERTSEIDQDNQASKSDKSIAINGRNLTNLGVYRQYVENYLKTHPKISDQLTVMCRQLPPNQFGATPLEIYAFSNDKEWVAYEHLIADIFDHLLSALRYFELESYEVGSPKIQD